jgi:hypothetical protein
MPQLPSGLEQPIGAALGSRSGPSCHTGWDFGTSNLLGLLRSGTSAFRGVTVKAALPKVAPVPTEREHVPGIAVDGKWYVTGGGCAADVSTSNIVEVWSA